VLDDLAYVELLISAGAAGLAEGLDVPPDKISFTREGWPEDWAK
jgi:hypothetical protein